MTESEDSAPTFHELLPITAAEFVGLIERSGVRPLVSHHLGEPYWYLDFRQRGSRPGWAAYGEAITRGALRSDREAFEQEVLAHLIATGRVVEAAR